MKTVDWDSRFPNFGYPEFLRIARKCHGAIPNAFSQGGEGIALNLDFSRLGRCYAHGMVPLVSFCAAIRKAGGEVSLTEPDDQNQVRYWNQAGWSQMLHGEDGPAPDRTRSYIPIQKYEDHRTLNVLVDTAIEIASRQIECEVGVISGLEWIVNEIADNVLLHSMAEDEDPLGYLQVVLHPRSDFLEIVVADHGIGIRQSLWSAQITANDEAAIQLALQQGVTRDKEKGAGNGLATCVRLIESTGGEMNIVSGAAEIWIRGGREIVADWVGHVPGTAVVVKLPTHNVINMSEATWGSVPVPAFETAYLTDDEKIHFRVREESDGFGTRGSGAQVRTKLENIRREHPHSKVTIDFSGLEVLTASFVDEVIGRLYVKTGALEFMATYELVNMSPFVHRTLEEVLANREQLEMATPMQGVHVSVEEPVVEDPTQTGAARRAVLQELLDDGILSPEEFEARVDE